MYPYNAYMPTQNSFPQRCEIIHINGENGARAFQMSPNSSALLLDDTAPLVWLAQTGGAGYYRITANATVAVTGTTAETMSMVVDGATVTASSETPVGAGDVVNLSIPWMLRKSCNCNPTTVSFNLASAGTVNNLTVIVERV